MKRAAGAGGAERDRAGTVERRHRLREAVEVERAAGHGECGRARQALVVLQLQRAATDRDVRCRNVSEECREAAHLGGGSGAAKRDIGVDQPAIEGEGRRGQRGRAGRARQRAAGKREAERLVVEPAHVEAFACQNFPIRDVEQLEVDQVRNPAPVRAVVRCDQPHVAGRDDRRAICEIGDDDGIGRVRAEVRIDLAHRDHGLIAVAAGGDDEVALQVVLDGGIGDHARRLQDVPERDAREGRDPA